MQCRDMLCAQSIYLKYDQDHSGMLSCHEARDALSAIGALLFSNTLTLCFVCFESTRRQVCRSRVETRE